MASEKVREFTDGNFEAEVLKSDVPVLVDFWAEWCQPCRLLTPTIDKLASSYEGKVKVGKVDIDNNQAVAFQYKIAAIPTVLVFNGGEVKKKFVGIAGQGVLEDALDEVLGVAKKR